MGQLLRRGADGQGLMRRCHSAPRPAATRLVRLVRIQAVGGPELLLVAGSQRRVIPDRESAQLLHAVGGRCVSPGAAAAAGTRPGSLVLRRGDLGEAMLQVADDRAQVA